MRIEPLYNLSEKSRQEEDATSNNYLVGKKIKFSKSNKLYVTKESSKILIGSFQFRYNPLISSYIGEIIENSNYITFFESKIDKSGLSIQDHSILDASYLSEASNLREKAVEERKNHENASQDASNSVDYGKNIKLIRLIRNQLIDNDKFMEDEANFMEDDEDNESGRNKNGEAKIKLGKEEEEQEEENGI